MLVALYIASCASSVLGLLEKKPGQGRWAVLGDGLLAAVAFECPALKTLEVRPARLFCAGCCWLGFPLLKTLEDLTMQWLYNFGLLWFGQEMTKALLLLLPPVRLLMIRSMRCYV
jgi:hypothetical protein